MAGPQTIPSHPQYRATEGGAIIGQRGRPLRLFPGTGGYLRFTTHEGGTWRQVSVHVMVCEAFYGPRPTADHQAAHINGIRTDNRASNLRWATRAENEADKRAHGRSLDGERHHQAKLTEAQVCTIRARLASGEQGSTLAREYGVTPTTITNIKKRKTWRYTACQ